MLGSGKPNLFYYAQDVGRRKQSIHSWPACNSHSSLYTSKAASKKRRCFAVNGQQRGLIHNNMIWTAASYVEEKQEKAIHHVCRHHTVGRSVRVKYVTNLFPLCRIIIPVWQLHLFLDTWFDPRKCRKVWRAHLREEFAETDWEGNYHMT